MTAVRADSTATICCHSCSGTALTLIGVALMVVATACSPSGDSWWGELAESDPCSLDLSEDIETLTSSRILEASVVEGSYEAKCVYDLSGDGEVALYVFHPSDPEYFGALRDGTVWTPGELPNTGYQGPDRTDGGGASVAFARAVTNDAAASVAVTLAGSDEELVAIGEELAARTVAELLERR